MHYDILMVHGLSRAHNCYLNITKHFSQKGYSVGLIYDLPNKIKDEKNLKPNQKLEATEKVFVSVCESLGAVICKPEGKYDCDLLILPQAYFEPGFFKWLQTNVEAKNKIGILLFTGSAQGIEQVKQLGVKRFYVNDRNALLSTNDEAKLGHLVEDVEIVSMGSPDKLCPIFEGLDIDYLVAFPTPLQFKTMEMRFRFYKNIYSLVSAIPKGDQIVLKRHSSKDGGNNFYPKVHRMPLWIASLVIKFYPRFLESIPRPLGTVIKDFLCLCYDRVILGRSSLLSALSPSANLGFEFFLPSIRKGCVTGLSGVIWHCLAYGKRVYNCDSKVVDETNKHWSHLQHYLIPWCENDLNFDSRKHNPLPDEIMKVDLFREISEFLVPKPETVLPKKG